MKDYIKKILLKNKITTKALIIFRKIRLLLFSYFNLPKNVKIPLNDNKKYIVLNTRDWVTANICKNKVKNRVLNYETNQIKVFNFIAEKSNTVFDVGTHNGIYAILAAKSKLEEVFAFDIDNSFLKIAKKHAVKNKVRKNITFIKGAIGNENDFISVRNFTGKSESKMFSLDSFCLNKNVWPDLIKMDIEGYELEALQGAKKVLKRKPIIMLALHPEFIRKRGKLPKKVFDILLENNFIIISLTCNLGREVSRKNINTFLNKKTVDFVCIHKNNKFIKDIKDFIYKI